MTLRKTRPVRVNRWNVAQALISVRRLVALLPDLSDEDLRAALKLESASRRRKSILRLLVDQTVRLNGQLLKQQLEGKYCHGSTR